MAALGELRNIWKNNPVGLVSVLLYILVIPLALIVAIPIGITLRNFDGMCILFAEVVWDNTFIYPWSDESCDFAMYLAVASIFYSFFMAVFTLMAVQPRTLKKQDMFGIIQSRHAEFVLESMNPVFTAINIIICGLNLISAIVVTVGFAEFCRDVVEDLPGVQLCSEAESYDWSTITVVGGTKGPRGHNFNTCLSFAVLGSWLLFSIWLVQMCLNFRYCCKGFTCGIAEEKQRASKSSSIALRRSRMASPIGTPGHMTPRGYGPPPPHMVAQAQMGSHPQVSVGPLPPKA